MQNPRDDEVIGHFETMDRASVADACARAREAGRTLAARTPEQRGTLLQSLRRALLDHADSLVDILIQEGGKTRPEAILLDVAPGAHVLGYYASIGPRALRSRKVPPFVAAFPRRATRVLRPRGVVGLISPWNHPIAIALSTIAPALVAGNAVVWKPSERATLTARRLHAIFVDVFAAEGLPAELLAVVTGGETTGAALVDADIDQLTFIGSTSVGRKVAARCGERLLPAVLELGGKAPAIVLADANVERTARALLFGAYAHLGQSCIAVERVFCDVAVFDALTARLATLLAGLRPDVDSGAVVLPQTRARLAGLLREAQSAGARSWLGASFCGVSPGFIDASAANAAAVRELLVEETFGPLLPIVRVTSVDEAIARANAHDKQLNAYVFSASATRARAVAARLAAPNVVINDVMVNYALPEVPFGGKGDSGFGRVHGEEGLLALCDEQIVVEGALPLDREPWWQPYGRVPDLVLQGLKRARVLLSFLQR